jgi:hypothetical protein
MKHVLAHDQDEPSAEFMGTFRETFHYLGMHFGGVVHANCQDGYLPDAHDSEALKFAVILSLWGRAGFSCDRTGHNVGTMHKP